MTDSYITGEASVIPFPPLRGRDTKSSAPATPLTRVRIPGLLRLWSERVALRHALRRLLDAGPHLVRDIGLDETLVRQEVTLPFWKKGRLRPGVPRLPAA